MIPYTPEDLDRINKMRKVLRSESNGANCAATASYLLFFGLFASIFIITSDEKTYQILSYSIALIVAIVGPIIISMVRKKSLNSSGLTEKDLNYHKNINTNIIKKYIETKGNFQYNLKDSAVNEQDFFMSYKGRRYTVKGEDYVFGTYKTKSIIFSEVSIFYENKSFSIMEFKEKIEIVDIFEGVFIKVFFKKQFHQKMAFVCEGKTFLDYSYPHHFIISIDNLYVYCLCEVKDDAKDYIEILLKNVLSKLFSKYKGTIRLALDGHCLYIAHMEDEDKFTIQDKGDITIARIKKVHQEIDEYFEILDMLDLESDIWDTLTDTNVI